MCMTAKNNWLSSYSLKKCREELLNFGLRKVVNYPKYEEVFGGVKSSISFICADRGYTGKLDYIEIVQGNVTNKYKKNIDTGLGCIPSSREQYTILKKLENE